MRKDFGPNPYMYPQPVLIIASYGPDGTPDAMNAAWGGISDRHRISMCLSAGHKTVKNILAKGAFTVSMGTTAQLVACDYVGLASGNTVPDKLARSGLTVTKSEKVDAPIINELPLALECKLVKYDTEDEILTGEIVNVSVDENALAADGKIDITKLDVLTYDSANHGYYALGQRVGSAFADGEKLM